MSYRTVTIVCNNFPGADLLSHGIAELELELYNSANGALVQTWRPSDDPDLGNLLVELSAEDALPTLSRSPANLAAAVPQGQNAASQSFEVWNSGGGVLNYTITDDVNWLSVGTPNGNSTGEREREFKSTMQRLVSRQDLQRDDHHHGSRCGWFPTDRCGDLDGESTAFRSFFR